MPIRKLTRGQKVILFIESYCVVPEGTHVGKPVRLAKFQKKFILAIYDNPFITDTAILSIARKNAKTATISFIVLAHLVGPEAIQNSRIISGAMSKEQAAEVYNLASKCVAISPKLIDIVHPIPSQKKLIGLMMNVEYQAISAEGKTAHGKSPVLAILDEVGQIKGPQSDFVDAIETAQGAYDDPLIIYISTQAATDADFFSIMIDDYKKNKPEKMVCHVYAAHRDATLLDRKAWKDSNPAIGLFRSLKDMIKLASQATRMPSKENRFRNLNLNQRVSVNSPFISINAWKKCGGKFSVKLEDCEEIYGGLDLSKRKDLTCLILIGRKGKKWYVFCYFWTPEKNLVERSKEDRVPYDVWVKKGFLAAVPGATIDYEYVAKEIAEITEDLDITAIAFDRWRMDILKKEFDDIDFDQDILVPWGQGFKDMSPAMDASEKMILNETLRHGNHPVLTMCAANAVVTQDPAENRKLDKMKASGRIDGMVALTMAAGASERHQRTEGDLDDFISGPISA